MELGAENRPKMIAAGVLGVLAIILLGRFLFSSSSPQPVAAAPANVPVVSPARPASGGKRSAAVVSSLDPTLRFDWLRTSEDTKYEGRGRNIFVPGAEPIPAPIASAIKTAKGPEPPPQPVVIPPPPINLKFYGFASSRAESKKIFLTDEGGDIFIAKEGDIIDRRYKILRISPTSVEVEDVLNNNRQQLPLIQGG